MSEQNSKQLNELQLSARIESERKNESKYFGLFTDLLKQKKDIILKKSISDQSQMRHYEKEMEVLKRVMTVERDALIGGCAVGVVTFFSLRLLPRIAIRLLGGESKIRNVEISTRNKPNAFLKKGGTFLFESMFAFWASWRGYKVATSMKANDLAVDVTKLPLCEGRSVICEEICSELTTLIKYKIPAEFWRNLDEEGALQKQESWQHIVKFSENCEKRRKYEEIIRKEQGMKDDEIITIPAPGVPENYVRN